MADNKFSLLRPRHVDGDGSSDAKGTLESTADAPSNSAHVAWRTGFRHRHERRNACQAQVRGVGGARPSTQDIAGRRRPIDLRVGVDSTRWSIRSMGGAARQKLKRKQPHLPARPRGTGEGFWVR